MMAVVQSFGFKPQRRFSTAAMPCEVVSEQIKSKHHVT
jgi:hypothetical protein